MEHSSHYAGFSVLNEAISEILAGDINFMAPNLGMDKTKTAQKIAANIMNGQRVEKRKNHILRIGAILASRKILPLMNRPISALP